MLEKTRFDVGDRIVHPVFGEGTIVSVDMVLQAYEIDFENVNGLRSIMFRAKLEKK